MIEDDVKQPWYKFGSKKKAAGADPGAVPDEMLEADIKQARVNRGGSRNGVSPFAMKGEIAKAELQRAKEALKALTRSFDPCGGGPGMDSLGLRATYEPGRFREVASTCSWKACPEDQLWGWGLDA